MRRFVPILLVLTISLLLCRDASCFEYPCTYTSKAGDFYDLSPLSKCDNSGYSAGGFELNVCNTVSACDSRSAICQGGTYSSGAADSSVFSDYTGGGKGVVQTYYNGTGGCPGNVVRKSIVTYVCNNNVANDPDVEFVSESPTCTYNFKIQSKYACPVTKAPQQQTCPVNVYLVPHSHDDVGWLDTIDGYYQSQVKHILDTVVSSLDANPDRRFIYVEQAFFTRWWRDTKTSDSQRNTLRRLVNNGQLEFVIGGWTMQDEACTTYGSDIDQMTQGHQFLLNTFGVRPTKGWQIDPFGASSVTPTLNKLAGFDGHLIDRITNKGIYESSQRLQFKWKGSPSQGAKTQIFTEIMGGSGAAYCDWISAFDFNSDPVTPANVATYASKFVSMVNERSRWYKTSNVLAAWGCDFEFQNATASFHSMDILVNYLQNNVDSTHIHVKYATLSDYFASWTSRTDVDWPVNSGGDFFPYDDGLWWTGYFTSRVELKGVVRQGEGVAKAIEPLYSIGRSRYTVDNTTALFNKVNNLRVANADATHHDGVTGTSVPNVVLMYQNDILSGITDGFSVISSTLATLISKGISPPTLKPMSNLLLLGSGQTAAVVLFNSLGWTRNDYYVVPVNRNDLTVTDAKQQKVNFQVNPTFGADQKTSKFLLYFQTSVGPLGYNTYFVSAAKMGEKSVQTSHTYEVNGPADTTLASDTLLVTISGTTGRVSNITNKLTTLQADLDQNILRYTSAHSGAYAFGPKGPAVPLSTKTPTSSVTKGNFVNEAYQIFAVDGSASSYAKQTVRIFNANGEANVGNFIEFAFELGALPSQVELVSSFQTSINNQGIFATDNNGFEYVVRENLWANSIEGNYYPMIYASYIEDDTAQLSVISERAHGCSSLADGQFEVMVHRNPDMGDGFGPGLTDTTVVTPKLRVILDTPEASKAQVYRQSYQLNFPLVGVSSIIASPTEWTNKYVASEYLLNADLPVNVHLLSLNALDSTTRSVILRLTHLFAAREDPVNSAAATVDLSTLFSNIGLKITSVQETTLTANKVIDTPTDMKITLNAKDIRTFLVEFSKN